MRRLYALGMFFRYAQRSRRFRPDRDTIPLHGRWLVSHDVYARLSSRGLALSRSTLRTARLSWPTCGTSRTKISTSLHGPFSGAPASRPLRLQRLRPLPPSASRQPWPNHAKCATSAILTAPRRSCTAYLYISSTLRLLQLLLLIQPLVARKMRFL